MSCITGTGSLTCRLLHRGDYTCRKDGIAPDIANEALEDRPGKRHEQEEDQ